MLAVDLDSNPSGDGTYISSWTYLNDSAVANMQSAPNKKSQITPSNRMNIRVRYLGRVGVEACMILGDGEQFAGNSYDTTNLSMRMERRLVDSVISLVSVSKLILPLF